MAASAIVALCLLALASAAPQNLQNLQCASSCDMPSQVVQGTLGKTFTYSYNVESSINIEGVNGATTQGLLSGTVQFSRPNPCEWVLTFTGKDENAKVSKYPMVFALDENDMVKKICAHQDDDTESINIKKAIGSSMRLTVPTNVPTTKEVVLEKTVLGVCPTAYSVKKEGEITTVNKEVIHSECQDHVYSHSNIPSILSKSPLPVQESKTECQLKLTSKIMQQTVTCKDTKVVRPAYGSYKYIEATQESTLQFLSEKMDMPSLDSMKGSAFVTKEWSHEHSMPAKNPALVGKLDSVLRNVCSMVQGQGHPDAASYVTEAIELLKHVPEEVIVTVANKIRAGDYCTDSSKLEALFMDAIAFVGEPGALKIMAKEVSAGRVTGGRTALYTAALHLLTKPTVNHVAALTPIVAMENPSSTLTLAAASVVHKYCKLNNGCENKAAVKNILNLLVGKLETQCTPSFSNNNVVTVLTTLKALGNIGYMAPEHAEKMIKCAKTEGVEVNVRFAATMALAKAPCMATVKNTLFTTALDTSLNTEVRIGSYIAAIKCAEESDIKDIIAKINTDSNMQVKSFVFSNLSNIKGISWPLWEQLQKILNTVNIPNTYGSNIFKYSKCTKASYNSAALGLGGLVDSNIIYERDSYLPRLVDLHLDMNLLGSFINIAEVGARVEGLDPIMKEAFGPESYLYKTPLKEIVKDTSLFVKQNAAVLYQKLETLIKQKGSFDINTIMQTLTKFLKTNNIKLPKTDMYAKLLGQELAFLSVSGPMQEVNVNNAIETITTAVAEALVSTKDLNIDTARAAHLHLDYSIPTIQGIPLKIKLEGTTVAGIKAVSKLESKAKTHDAILKIIPTLSIAIDGFIGYGATAKHGLKMKNSVYSTNGFALYATLKNGQDIEMKFELPEKMELLNVKSEAYLMTANKMMNEVKVTPNGINDQRIAKQHCLNIAESLTGLHFCYDMNIPNINNNALPLGLPVSFKIYIQKSVSDMKGYRIMATIKNKADKKVLKMVAGTYGSSASTESSVKLTYTKEGNTYLTEADIKTLWFASNVEVTLVNQADLMSLQTTVVHKLTAGTPMVGAVKFNIKNEEIANGKQYQVAGFAGLTKVLTDAHRFWNVKLSHALTGAYNKANFLMNVETLAFPVTLAVEMDVPTTSPWLPMLHNTELKVAIKDAIAFEGLILRKAAGQYLNSVKLHYYRTNVLEIEATHAVTGEIFKNFNLVTDTRVILGKQEIGTTLTFKHENALVAVIWELRNSGVNIFNINLKHSMETKMYATAIEIGFPTLPKSLKFNNVIEVVEFLNYKIITDVLMDSTALVHIEGPVSWMFSKDMLKHNMDLKISGAFEGTTKLLNTVLLSLEKTQFTIDMRHSTTPLLFIDVLADRTNAVETAFKAAIHLPIIVKAEYEAVITSGLIHTSMNTLVLPTTSAVRRFKGYADFNLNDQKLKADFYWDAEKDNNKKFALTTSFKVDTPMRKLLVQGDFTLTSLAYGFKLEALSASPFDWFLGTSGIEFSVTAPSNKMFIAKALCTTEYTESLFILKPLLAFHTINEDKYEISSSLAVKKLPGFLSFDISSELTLVVPKMNTLTIAHKFLYEDKNGACTIIIKTGITGLNEPFGLEITHKASGNKYTTLFKAEYGVTVSSVTSNIVATSGLKAFDITVDAVLPFTSVRNLVVSATKTADGTATITITKNQTVLAKLHYIMASLMSHTISIECSSRTIEIFAGITGNEMTLKVFPEKNVSPKVAQAIIHLSKKTGSAQVECFITAPSLSKEMRIATEFALANSAKDNLINVNVQFPVAEFKTLVNAMVEELTKIYEDMVKDGILPDYTVLIKKLEVVLAELTNYMNVLKTQFLELFNNYWTIVRNKAMEMWKLYEADLMAFLKNVHSDILRYWEILKIEVPTIYNNLMTKLRKTELWKMLHEAVTEIVNRFPLVFNIIGDFYNKVVITTFEDFLTLFKNIMALPTFSFEGVWKILKNDVPAMIVNVTEQLLNTDLVTLIIKKFEEIRVRFPAVYNAFVEFLTHVIVPAYEDLIIIFKKVMTLNLTNVSELINFLMKDIVAFFNNTMTRLMNCEVVKMIITNIKNFIATNPIIGTVYTAVVEVSNKILMALKDDLAMFYKRLMDYPMIKKLVDYIMHIFNTKNFNMIPVTWQSFTNAAHVLFTDVFGWTYTIAGNQLTAVVALPCSVSTVNYIWTSTTTTLTDVADDLVKEMLAAIENIPVVLKAVKKYTFITKEFIAEQIPITVELIKTYVPKFINDLVPTINNFVEFLLNTKFVKFLMVKIEEVISMYPAEFKAMKEYVEWFMGVAIEYTVLVYNKMMDIPVFKKIVDYIWQLINRKDLYSSMVSSMSSVASTVSSYASSVSMNVPTFIKLHTPSAVYAWMTSLTQ